MVYVFFWLGIAGVLVEIRALNLIRLGKHMHNFQVSRKLIEIDLYLLILRRLDILVGLILITHS